VKGDGSAVTIQNSAANGFEAAPMTSGSGTVYAAKDITDATAPYISAADAQAILGAGFYAADHTIMCAVSNGPSSSVNPTTLSHGQSSVDGLDMIWGSSYLPKCRWNLSGSNVQTTSAAAQSSRWIVHSCFKNGTTFGVRVNGTETTAVSALTIANPAARNLYFGRYDSGGFPLRGPLYRCRFYNTALSSTTKALREAQLLKGLAIRPADTYYTTTRASAAFDVYADGYVYASGDNVRIPHSTKGLQSFSSFTNYATNSTQASSQTAIGTSVVSSTDTIAGPFDRYIGTTAVDLLNDDDAAAREGVQTASAGTAAGTYTLSAIVGTTGATDMSLAIDKDTSTQRTVCAFSGINNPATATCAIAVATGTTNNACGILCATGKPCSSDATTFPGTMIRPYCTATVTAATTNIVGQTLVGASVGGVGSIRFAEHELTNTSAPMPPCPAGATAQTCSADVHTVPTTGWPTTAGEISLVYTAGSSAAPSANGNTFIDTRTTATTNGLVLWRDSSQRIIFTVYAGAQVCTISTSARTWTAAKTIKARWSATSCEVLEDGVSVGTGVATGSPASHTTSALLGRNFNATSWADGHIRTLCVGRAGACP
jgi:hypothetical protein